MKTINTRGTRHWIGLLIPASFAALIVLTGGCGKQATETTTAPSAAPANVPAAAAEAAKGQQQAGQQSGGQSAANAQAFRAAQEKAGGR